MHLFTLFTKDAKEKNRRKKNQSVWLCRVVRPHGKCVRSALVVKTVKWFESQSLRSRVVKTIYTYIERRRERRTVIHAYMYTSTVTHCKQRIVCDSKRVIQASHTYIV